MPHYNGMRQRSGVALPPQKSEPAPAPASASPAPEEDAEDPEVFYGWMKTWAATLAGVFVYFGARWLVEYMLPPNQDAYAELMKAVPPIVYQMSSTAFFTALVLNLTSLLFEDNAPKRQLALLSVAIKGAACHTDMLLVTGRTTVIYDAFGSIIIPQRYVQWLVTTPTMVYILSKISDFTPRQTATAIVMDVVMIVSGFGANLVPGPYLNWPLFGLSMLCFVGVMYMMGLMVFSAIKEHPSASSRRSLLFIYMCTLLIWVLFPVAWILHVIEANSPQAEYLNVFANFMAKVLFSSSIMYGNYMTIAQRRLLAQQAAENAHRVRMIQDLKDAVTRKDQFMSLMSHELRTPLNGIIQLSDALVRGAGGEMNPKGQHFVKTIKNSSNHLLNIINDILDVAALKEGKLTIKHELCSLAKAVDHVVDIVAPLAKKDVVIERSVDPRTPCIIADFSRVIQILYNLIGNALKFTHKGQVAVRVSPSGGGSSVIMQVSDTGIGIAPDRINSIWGAFEQVDMSVTRKYGGTGLGLNIVKQLVEAHEGRIECRSVEGEGTTFTVTLPVMQGSTRKSLEVQVLESLSACGHGGAKEALSKRRPKRMPGSTQLSGAIEETISQLTRGLARRPSGGYTTEAGSDGDGGGGNSHSHDDEETLYRRRTKELERENLMGDLQRRTEHKRSIDEASRVSKQLHLSAPERRAERDSRSLERPSELEVEERLVGAEGSSKWATSAASRGGYGVSAGDDGGDDDGAGRGFWTARRTIKSEDSGSNGGRRPRRSGWQAGVPATVTGMQAATAAVTSHSGGRFSVAGAFPDGEDDAHDRHQRTSIDLHVGVGYVNAGGAGNCSSASTATGFRKLSGSTSLSNSKPGAACFPHRMSAFGSNRGGGGMYPQPHSFANGGGNCSGSGLTNPLFKSALESDLYRNSFRRTSFDEASSVGGEIEAGSMESILMQRSSSRRGNKTPAERGSKLHNSTTLATTTSSSCTMPPPPPGLTLDKLAYSDMYGTVQILSVDDEEVNQIVLEEILTSSGYHFARCMDGLEALEWLCASETMPDLILLDCMMPNMSGHEFCATLRKVIPGNVLPVIMVSAKSDEDNIVEGLRSGSNDFVRKPYQREELLARIETQLRLKSDSWWLAELINNVDGRETESMKLLKNILPESIIARMQQGQKFVADSHRHVVILFSDIVGFTSLSSKLPTAEVFLMLSNMFTAFDKLTDRFSVYKVETIGDAYMVAAGHDEDDDKAHKGSPLMRVLGFARAMLDVVRNITAPNGERLRIRIGVHCGPAFAGVIGMKCPRYCFLGDTVNTASRMESTGFPMCVHVSEDVFRHHPNAETELQEVGEREVKGKGRMRTYLLRAGAWEQALREYAARLQAAAAAATGSAATSAQQTGGGTGSTTPLLGCSSDLQTQPPAAPPLPAPPPPSMLHSDSFRLADLACSPDSTTAGGSPLLVLEATVSGGIGELCQQPQQRTGTDDGCQTASGNGGGCLQDMAQAAALAAQSNQSAAVRQLPPLYSGVSAGAGPSGGGSSTNSIGRSPLSRPEAFPVLKASAGTGGAAAAGKAATAGGVAMGCAAAPQLNAHAQDNRLLGKTFGSEAYYREDSSEDGAGTFACAASMNRLHPQPNSTMIGNTPIPSLFNSARVVSGSADAAAGGTATEAPPPPSTTTSAPFETGSGTALGHKYYNELFHSSSVILGSGGTCGAGAACDAGGGWAPTVVFLEQRLNGMGSQLVSEMAARQRLQEELDTERCRTAGALQQAGLLARQLRLTSAAAAAVAAAAHGKSSSGAITQPPYNSNGSSGVIVVGSSSTNSGDSAEAGSAEELLRRSLDANRTQQHRHQAVSSLGQLEDTDVIILTEEQYNSSSSTGNGGNTGGTSALPMVGEAAATTSSARANAPHGGDDSSSVNPSSPFVLTSDMQLQAGMVATRQVGSNAGRGCSRSGATDGSGRPGAAGNLQPSAQQQQQQQPVGDIAQCNAAANPPASGYTSAYIALASPMGIPRKLSALQSLGLASLLHLPPATPNGAAIAATSNTAATAAAATAGPANMAAGASPGGSAVLPQSGTRLSVLPSTQVLPSYGIQQLFLELGLLPYLPRFRKEAIRLDMLLGMEVKQLERLGLRPLGYCIRVKEAVMELARGLLRACEEAALVAEGLSGHPDGSLGSQQGCAAAAAGSSSGGGGGGGAEEQQLPQQQPLQQPKHQRDQHHQQQTQQPQKLHEAAPVATPHGPHDTAVARNLPSSSGNNSNGSDGR